MSKKKDTVPRELKSGSKTGKVNMEIEHLNLKETEIIILRDAIRTKKVKKNMDVDVVMNFKTGKKSAIHPETGELLWEKDLTPEDRQLKMF